MFRFIMIVIVIALIAGVAMKSKRGSDSSAASSGPAYGEVRVKVVLGQKDLEFVIAGEKPTETDCDRSRYKFPALCRSGVQCEITKVECGNDLAQRYKNMLDKRPAQTHYVHFTTNVEGSEPHRAVLVGWGLTEEESKFICQHVANGQREAGNKQMTVTCI
jgi:hypothetical protein